MAEKAKGKQDQQRLDGVQGQKLKGTNLIREMEKSMLEFLGIVKVSEPMLTLALLVFGKRSVGSLNNRCNNGGRCFQWRA